MFLHNESSFDKPAVKLSIKAKNLFSSGTELAEKVLKSQKIFFLKNIFLWARNVPFWKAYLLFFAEKRISSFDVRNENPKIMKRNKFFKVFFSIRRVQFWKN